MYSKIEIYTYAQNIQPRWNVKNLIKNFISVKLFPISLTNI